MYFAYILFRLNNLKQMKHNENGDIFICGYKDFDCPVTSNVYKIIKNGNVEITNTNLEIFSDNTGDNISSRNLEYSELTMYYWIWKNYPIKDYIGFCQYRRYYEFMDKIPEFDKEFKNCDIILPRKIKFSLPLAAQYHIYHNVDDLQLVSKIIEDLYPNIFQKHLQILFQNFTMHPCNMFITRKETFNDMMEFLFSILFEWEKRMGLKTKEDYLNHVEKNKQRYLKPFSPNGEINYQSRILGFLSERILEIYYCTHQLKIREYDINEIQKKYNSKLYRH